MSRNIDSVLEAALSDYSFKLAFLVRLDFDEGTLGFTTTTHNISYDNNVYVGFGNLGKVSALKESSQMDAQTYQVNLSAVKPEIMAAVLNSEYTNRSATCHLAVIDKDGRIVGEPMVYFKGTMDSLECSYGKSGTVTVNIIDDLGKWDIPKPLRYTNEEQLALHPGDRGLEFVSELADKEIIWPAKSWYS